MRRAVPIVDIVRVSGLLNIPLVFLSLLGFLKVLKFNFWEWKTQILFWSMGLGNTIAIVLFTQVWPEYFIVMLMAGATISLACLYVYGALAKRQPVPSVVGASRQVTVRPSQPRFKAFAPLILGAVIVVLRDCRGGGLARTFWISGRSVGIRAHSHQHFDVGGIFYRGDGAGVLPVSREGCKRRERFCDRD